MVKQSVGQIATFQNLKARSVLKDVARAMGMPAPEAQRIASLVPDKGQGKTYTIEEALEVEPKLKALHDSDPARRRADSSGEEARRPDASRRHARRWRRDQRRPALRSRAVLQERSRRSSLSTTRDDVEAAGLVKFDFLGLKTLTVIDIAEKLVNARPERKGRPAIVLSKIAAGRSKNLTRSIASGETTGVFQLESSGMQQLFARPEAGLLRRHRRRRGACIVQARFRHGHDR